MSNDDLNIPETDGQDGLQYRPEDADGNGIPDGAEQKASGAKYDSVFKAYRSKDGFFAGIWAVIRETTAGQNTAGVAIGVALDVLEVVLPISKVSLLRRTVKKSLNLNEDRNYMKDAIKRAFTSDGGTVIRVRDEDGNISLVTAAAFVIRALLMVGLLYLADLLGVLEPTLQLFGLS